MEGRGGGQGDGDGEGRRGEEREMVWSGWSGWSRDDSIRPDLMSGVRE
jgi:hypothetical protein